MTSREPFLQFPTDLDGWHDFVGPQLDARIEVARSASEALKDGKQRTVTEIVELWNDLELTLSDTLSRAHLISESHPDAEVRAAAEKRAQAGEAVISSLNSDRELWRVFADAAENAHDLDPQGQRLLERVLRDFRRGGVDLDDEKRQRVKELADRDTELNLEFSRNIREGRREIRVTPDALAGLPQDFIDARPVGVDGLVTLSTDYPDLMPVRDYAQVRETRRALVDAYNDLAWPENDKVLAELFAVRHERAQLLGFTDWADYETETRMIGTGAAIPEFLASVDAASDEASRAEYERMLARLRRDHPDAEAVEQSDFFFLLGEIKREDYDVDAQEVRSYFPFGQVLGGVLDTTAKLLDITYEPVEDGTWHEDVVSYNVRRGGELLGRIHLDLHPRDGKYNHAACFGLVTGVQGRQLPEGVLLCNFSRGLLEHDEVVTFFHEFGHLVHYILGGDQPVPRFSGYHTEWDFVEAPSQLLEEWAWDASVLQSFARDASGTPIPTELVDRMSAADAFGRAIEVRRQLGHARVSYHLHVDRPADLQAATIQQYELSSPVRQSPSAHSYAGFGHLGGYGACYYTYQWSLVIARDLLSAFGGSLFDEEIAGRYRREILEPGGSRDAADMVERFLGRPYSFEAYRAWLAGE